MAHRFGGDPTAQRRHTRVPGPFEGRLIAPFPVPVLIYELSISGGFVHLDCELRSNENLCFRIALPGNGSVVVEAETVYRHPAGVAVRFVDLAAETEQRLALTIEALKGQTASE
jgi:hypothetical protein